ncbi:Sn1-specific diacylglycerol lipase alpha [Glycine soja]|nr:Sn1-specific diacylglycerol lipase alpha [Glycine soja]
MEVVSILTEAIKSLGYKEKWHILNLPIAIASAVLDMGKKTVARECGERSDCVQLKAPEVIKELYEIKKLLTRTLLFSRKRFHGFLFAAGFDKEDVLLRKRTARILRPVFTVIRDIESKSVLVFIRGTRSLNDTLTAALCAPVSFEHRRNNNIVSGHAHRGMVAAAYWILDYCTPVLKKALDQYPHFKIKIVGHSLGGGTAALLTFKLREIQEFSSSTCVTFGPAACMTLELAEFGKPFIISIINGYDIVPTLSVSSVHDFISEGRDRSNDQNILTAVRSHIPIAKAIAGHAITRCTQVVKKHKHGTRSLLPWHIRENIDSSPSSKSDNIAEAYGSSETNFESLLTEEHLIMESMSDDDEYNSSSEGSDGDDSDGDEDELSNKVGKLKLGKEVATNKNIAEEESDCPITTSSRRRLYPPGRIMHIIPIAHSSENPNSNHNGCDEKHVSLYETPRELYGKLRLSRRMILDHKSNKYLKVLQQLINQLEKESFKYRGG